jgi:hypothetical protein
VRRALLGVVDRGTAKWLNGTYRSADGDLLPVGGKTGTGDNRFDRFGTGGRLISQRVIDRRATFVFFLGDRFFGTVTAYVPGAIAGNHHFTGAIAVQLLKATSRSFNRCSNHRCPERRLRQTRSTRPASERALEAPISQVPSRGIPRR